MANLDKPWIILHLRFGGASVRQPTREQLEAALADLFDAQQLVAIPEGIRDEHPSSWLRYGFDDGPEYCIDIYEGAFAIFSKNADQDDAEPLWERRMDAVTRAKALELWMLLAAGEIEQLEAQAWS